MFGSNQFTFETPNVIDMGDIQPPTPPSRGGIHHQQQQLQQQQHDRTISPGEETTRTTSTATTTSLSVTSTPNSITSRKSFNDNNDDDMNLMMDNNNHSNDVHSSSTSSDSILLARENATRLLNDIRDLELQHHQNVYPTGTTPTTSFADVQQNQHPSKPLSQRLPFRDFPTYDTDHDEHHHSLPTSAHDAYMNAGAMSSSNKNKKSFGRTTKILSAPRIHKGTTKASNGTTTSNNTSSSSSVSFWNRWKGRMNYNNYEEEDKQSLYETDKDTIFSSHMSQLRAVLEELWFYIKLYRRCILIIVLLVSIVVITVFLITKTKFNGSSSIDGKIPNFSGTDRYDQIVKYISETKAITTKDILLAHDGTTSTTPQNAALNWIAGIDTMQYTIDHPQFIQRYIIAVLYFATGGKLLPTDSTSSSNTNSNDVHEVGWTDTLHFLSNTNECTWSNVITIPSYMNKMINMGVSCNTNNDITSIFIPNNGLAGSIPSEIGHLTFLSLFGLHNNDHIVGSIPSTFELLINLLYINLNQNQITGTIPNFVGNWNDCEVLGLESNNITGTIPASLGTMSRLITIALSNNNLTGTLDDLRHISSIQYFYVANNHFTGEVEEEFFYNMQKIREFDVSHNELQGEFPFRMLLKLESLRSIDIAHNQFTGTFPRSIQTPNYVLRYLNIRNNRISGSLPSTIHLITQLQHFDITNNIMAGTIPNSIGKCTGLEYLFLGNNTLKVVDSDGDSLVPPLSELESLRELSLTGLGIQGRVPLWLHFLTDLEMLDLSYNEYSGTIPHKLWSLPKLYYLIINDNWNITGTLPTSGGEQLSVLSIHHTNIDDTHFDAAVCKDTNVNAVDGGSGIIVFADCNSGCTDTCCTDCCTPPVDDTKYNDWNDPCGNSNVIAQYTDGIDHIVESVAFDPSILEEANVFDEVDEMIDNP